MTFLLIREALAELIINIIHSSTVPGCSETKIKVLIFLLVYPQIRVNRFALKKQFLIEADAMIWRVA